MKPTSVHFRARLDNYGLSVNLYGFFQQQNGEIEVINPTTITRYNSVEEAPMPSVPFLSLHPEDAQQLMDALWDAGLRPTEGTGSAGAMAAVQRHLEDMRTLVFKTQPK